MSSQFAFLISILLLLLQQISAANLPKIIKKQPNLPHHQTQAQQYLHPHQLHSQLQQHGNGQQTQKQTTAQLQQQQVQTVQYVHDNDEEQQQQQQQLHQQESSGDSDSLKNSNIDEDTNNDPYQILSDLKPESPMPNSMNYPWNPYSMYNHNLPFPYGHNYPSNPYEQLSPSQPPAMPMPMPKFLPFVGYAQPVFIPFPLYIAPDMFYPGHETSNDLEELTMSRAAHGRRPGVPNSYQRPNSPIYYVRLPPTPYMFVPNPIGPTGPFGNSFSPLLTYQPMPTFSSFGSVFNLPVNFLANGKPSHIYQMGAGAAGVSSELPTQPPPSSSSSSPFSGYHGFNARPPTPSNPYRPQSNYNMPPPQGFGLTSAIPPPQHDSKMTSLKRPFVFNGRPEDIYILPNNFNPLYPENSYY